MRESVTKTPEFQKIMWTEVEKDQEEMKVIN